VVKNNGAYCEILYSWYVKHHHTLNRQIKHKRIVQQMNEIIRDHIDSDFIARVEYRKIREIGKEIDFFIRYFPGLAAKQSIARVAAAISKKRKPPAGAPRAYVRRRSRMDVIVTPTDNPQLIIEAPKTNEIREPVIEIVRAAGTALTERVTTLSAELAARGLFRSQATKLLISLNPEQLEKVGDFIEYWDAARSSKPVTPGLLYDLIRNGDPLPIGFETQARREGRLEEEERRNKLARLDEEIERRHGEYCRRAIDRLVTEIPPDEFERRLSDRREETSKANGFWGQRPELADQFARQEVRAEIARSGTLRSLQEFRNQELPTILHELGLDPAELGLEVAPPPAQPEGHPLPDALYDPPIAELPQLPSFVPPEENA